MLKIIGFNSFKGVDKLHNGQYYFTCAFIILYINIIYIYFRSYNNIYYVCLTLNSLYNLL